MNFQHMKAAVAASFAKIVKGSSVVLRTSAPKDGMWERYLSAFPEGTNPIFRERTEHDCNCCKSFVRSVGNVVGVIDGKLVSIWDVVGIPNESVAYKVVAKEMSKYVKSFRIDTVFLSTEPCAGTNKTFRDVIESQPVSWDHFFINIPREYVVGSTMIGPMISEINSDFQVLNRSLTEIDIDSVDTVLELINQNAIYRGSEHKYSVSEFQKLKKKYDKLPIGEREIYVWSILKNTSASIKRIRNTSIGTLLVALSSGEDLEAAVGEFERMVAPSNYKRPTALVTERMVEQAKKDIEDLGLTSSLFRRRATKDDLNVNDILFIDRDGGSVNDTEVDDVFASVAKGNTKKKTLGNVQEYTIKEFLENILPTAKKVELMMDNRLSKNLVTLVTAEDPTAQSLFKWGNNFSWSYTGDLADSDIKTRVKNAGGSVEGDVCCRLAWFNTDDLDFHMIEPDGNEIYFGNKGRMSRCGGMLDVDMNAFSGLTTTPVENIFYSNKNKMKEGVYQLKVHNYNKRNSTDVGFVVEVEILGEKYVFEHPKAVRDHETVEVFSFRYSKAGGFTVLSSIPSTSVTREVWGIHTGNFVPVDVITLSPNYWEDSIGVGNKHYFFMLKGCVSDEKTRGFYNEQLSEVMNKHRKVLEIVGGKLSVNSDVVGELSGLGFSETQRNEVVLRVSGSFTRVIKVKF